LQIRAGNGFLIEAGSFDVGIVNQFSESAYFYIKKN